MKLFNRQSAAFEPAAIPFSLTWRDPDGRLTLDIRFRFLRECCHTIETTDPPTFGLLSGSEDAGTDKSRTVRVVEAEALSLDATELRSRLRAWHESANKHLSVVGFYVEPKLVTSGILAQTLETCADLLRGPVLLLEFNRDAGAVWLKQWNPETREVSVFPLLFPSHWMRLRQQNYAPFDPFYFNMPAGVPAETHQTMTPASWHATQHGPAEGSGEETATPHRSLQVSPQGVSAIEPSPGRERGITISPGVMIAALSVVIAVLAAALWWLRPGSPAGAIAERAVEAPRPEPQSTGLNLEVIRRGRDLQIMWDRNGPVVQSASVGLLQITEGGRQSEIVLPARQLKTGQIMYLPKTGDIELELHVITPSGLIREMVRVIEAGSTARSPQQTLMAEAAGAVSAPDRADRLLPEQARARVSEPEPAPPARIAEARAAGNTPAQPVAHTQSAPAQPLATRAASPEHTAASSSARPQEPPANGREIRTIFIDPPPPLTAANSSPVFPLHAAGPVQQSIPSSIAPPKPEPAPAASVPASPGRVQAQSQSPQPQLPAPSGIGRPDAPPPQRTAATAGFKGPVALSQSRPVVPTSIQRMLTREIVVEVTATIDEEGRVIGTNAPMTDGKTGYLASLAKEAVSRWRFQPATSDGKPVRSQHIVRFRFAP